MNSSWKIYKLSSQQIEAQRYKLSKTWLVNHRNFSFPDLKLGLKWIELGNHKTSGDCVCPVSLQKSQRKVKEERVLNKNNNMYRRSDPMLQCAHLGLATLFDCYYFTGSTSATSYLLIPIISMMMDFNIFSAHQQISTWLLLNFSRKPIVPNFFLCFAEPLKN